jgi:hypothetical protein
MLSANVLSFIVIVLWLEMDYGSHRSQFLSFDDYFHSVSEVLFLTVFLSISLNFVPFLGTIATIVTLFIYSFRDIVYGDW